MAAQGKHSRWGTFLSQAVAGVESRLDNILAEGEDGRSHDPSIPASPAITATKLQQSPQQLSLQTRSAASNSRSSSSNRTNDRLQARLAQAMAGKATGSGAVSKTTSSARSSVDLNSRPSLERRSTDRESEARKDGSGSEPGYTTASAPKASEVNLDAERAVMDMDDEPREPSFAALVGEPSAQPSITEKAPEEHPLSQTITADAASDTELLSQLQESRVKQQEEIQEYIERIDSLQSKLQYLSKTAADSAKKAASAARSGTHEQKLAEKDEKIALLMEEGQKLSANEHNLRTTIKKLRAQMGENERQASELRKHRDQVLVDAEALRARLDGPEEAEKRQEEFRRTIVMLQKEVDVLKKESAWKDEAQRKSDQEWKTKLEQAESSHRDLLNKAIAAERQKQKALEDANAALCAEKEAAIEKARREEVEWREKMERAQERSRVTEEELKTELHAVERKLEAMRMAAEEASSGSGGEAQVKMLRQIETLQTQYASARENWQGIEASLIAKSSNLEKERDEAQRRESEMRKKARDAAVRLRHVEEELQDAQPSIGAARQELESCRDEVSRLQASYKASQDALTEAQRELEKMRQNGADGDSVVDAERHSWVDDVAGAISKGHQSRPESPLLSVSRAFSSDMLGLPGAGKPRRSHTPGSTPDSPVDTMSPIRRFSGQLPLRRRESSYAGSGLPPTPFSPFEPPSEAAELSFPAATDRENGAPETGPSSPRNVANDMISVSTVAAGPSVQLVERMSAAIRRLEAEKVTAKEEMTRICSQRDEARSDLVALMKELEETKAAATKVPDLEKEVARLDARYQTTLEMLGEKSELVEELKADVEDVKAMYRELVERTVT